MVVFLKFLMVLLLAFTPFSFAATEPWAFSVLQAGVLIAWFLLLVTRREIFYPSLFKPILYVFTLVITLALVQSCFAQTLLEAVPAHPITLMRLYTLEHASLFVTYLAVVLLAIQLFPSFNEVKQLLWMSVGCAMLVALCALCFPRGAYVAKLTGITKYAGAIGPFVNRNHAGMFFALNSLAALGLCFTHQLHYQRVLNQAQKTTFTLRQICLALITLGLMIATVFTRSRGAMLSLFTGLFSYAFLCVWCVPSKLRKRLKGFFYTFMLLIASVGWIYTHVEDINKFAHRSTGVSTQTRQMMYNAAQQMLQKYPVWGIGIGAMPVAITSYTPWDTHQYIERLHNDWLEMTLGMGLAGMGLALLGLAWFWLGALKRLKRLETRKQLLFAALLSALIAMGTGSLVDFHFFIPGCALVFFLFLGLVLAPTFHKHHVHSLPCSPVIRLILFVVLLSAAWVPLQKTRCWRQFFMGQGLKTEHKLEAYEQGLTYYPSPRYAMRLASAYYNVARHNKDPMIKLYYFELAQETAQSYLEQYPNEKELSRLYVRVQRQLH